MATNPTQSYNTRAVGASREGRQSPWVREVSDARRPSLKLTGDLLWASRFWELRACMVGLAGLRLTKGDVMRGEGWLANMMSLREGLSSRKCRSLWTDPISYSESTLSREGLSLMEKIFPSREKTKTKHNTNMTTNQLQLLGTWDTKHN